VRVALIADVHGNLLALEAVLAELEREEPDRVVCLGDVAAGPQASEALARVRELECPVVMGNWDAWFLDGIPGDDSGLAQKLAEIGRWWSSRISPADRAFIESFVPTVELELGDETKLLCFHGSPGSFNDVILSTTSDQALASMLGGAEAPVLAGGHTHVQMVRRLGTSTIVNPGSVGLPFRRWMPDDIRVAWWAEYGIVSSENGRLTVELRRTTYDVERFLQLSLASGMPHARWWAATWARD
jgi:putative phosphoesterase